MKPTLVILAAGMGSRYGGLKQLEAVGPGGATIMDYTLYDALRAGFGRVVFVIRPDMERDFHAAIGSRYAGRIAVDYAFQTLDTLPPGFVPPPGRTKPWGTGHAVLVTAGQVREPFAVANADDFYGSRSLAALGEFLVEGGTAQGGTALPDVHPRSDRPTKQKHAPEDRATSGRATSDVQHGSENRATRAPTFAMIGYRLGDTLSDTGTVSRGCCESTADGWLRRITEITAISRDGADARYTDAAGATHTLSGDTRVSMNLWGFTPELYPAMRRDFEDFLRGSAASEKAEFYLPVVVQNMIDRGAARVRVLPAGDKWCGITNREDKREVEQMIAGLIEQGVYPRTLWP